jgi:hypothetical protein
VSWLVTSMFHHEVLAGNTGLLQLLFNLGTIGARSIYKVRFLMFYEQISFKVFTGSFFD